MKVYQISVTYGEDSYSLRTKIEGIYSDKEQALKEYIKQKEICKKELEEYEAEHADEYEEDEYDDYDDYEEGEYEDGDYAPMYILQAGISEFTIDEPYDYRNITYEVDEMLKKVEYIKRKLAETKTVVTHFGDDLDNKSATYALEKWAKEQGILKEDENLQIDRVPAGKIKEGMLNVDTGGHRGSRQEDDGTIVIDGNPAEGVKSASEAISNLGIYVPKQIVELADTVPNKVSALDSRSGLALIRYLSGEQAFKLAEEGLLDKTLTDEQLEKYGLEEAHEKQQGIIDNAVEKIEKYTKELANGEKIVLAPEQIIAGSMIAYEKGIPYYASASNHLDKDKNVDGVTFAISSKPGTKLPKEILEYGEELVEQYRIDENTSGVFVNPNGQMIVAGGFKNPEFKIPNETIKGMLDKIEAKFMGKDIERAENQTEH